MTTSEPIKSPFGVDFDSQGNMVIVELEGGRIHRLSPNGNLTTIAGDGSKSYEGDGGPAAAATFNGMHNVAVTPNDDIYIADSWNHCIRKINGKSGIISTFAGTGEAGFSGNGGPADKAKFDFIMCITLNTTNDAIYVADLKNRRIRMIKAIRKYDPRTKTVTTIVGQGHGRPVFELLHPHGVCFEQGRLYVVDTGNNRILKVDMGPKGPLAPL